MSVTSTQTPDMDHLLSVLDGFKGTMIIFAACELKLFDELHQSPRPTSAADVANGNGWNVDATRRLMDACVAHKLLVKSFDENGIALYKNAAAAIYLLRHGMPSIWGYVNEMKRYISTVKNLSTVVRTGEKPVTSPPQRVTTSSSGGIPSTLDRDVTTGQVLNSEESQARSQSEEEKLLLRYQFFDSMCRPHVDTLVRMLDLGQHKRVVDLGAGSGVVSFAIRRAYPNVKVTLLDRPPVIQLVRNHFLADNNVTGSPDIELIEGDFFDVDLPVGDLYVLSKVVHDMKDEDQIHTILQRINSVIDPGGAILLLEKCMMDTKDGPAAAHEWDMMVLSSCGGRIRSGQEYTDLLVSEGFAEVTIKKTQERCSYDLIYAKKTS